MPAPPSTTRRRRSTIRSTSTPPRRELAKAGLKDTDGNGIVNFPAGTAGGAGRRDHAAGQRRLPDRQEPRRRRRRARWSRSASASSSTLVAGIERDGDAEQRQVRLAGLPQPVGADLGRAEHRQRSLRPVRRPAGSTAPAPTARSTCCRSSRSWSTSVNTFIATSDAAERVELMKTVPEDLHRERLRASVSPSIRVR